MSRKKKDDSEKLNPDIRESENTEVVSEDRETAENEAIETVPVTALTELQNALSAEQDRYLRLAAEYDNYRKRSQKERDALFVDVKADTVTQLLPVYDNLERALKQKCTDDAFYKGVEMTMTQLTDIFAKLGVTPIDALGQPFDPLLHDAVMHEENEEFEENTISEEFQKGFRLGEKIIRHSVVKVAN